MEIVLDSNIIFSALIKDSIIRELILNFPGKLLFPEYIFEEIIEHKEELAEKLGLNKGKLEFILNNLLKNVKIVPTILLEEYKQEATELMKNLDIDDILFIACALKYPNSSIWSNDKNLRKQNKIRIFSTKEILELINSEF